jgi:hypothetical protein
MHKIIEPVLADRHGEGIVFGSTGS